MSHDAKIRKLKADGIKQLQSRQFQKAKATYHSICKRDDKDVEAILNLGVVYAELKEYLKANECFTSANKILPDNVMILVSLGRSSLMLNKYTEAINYLNQALLIDNKNLQIKHLLVRAYKNSGELKNAVAELMSILKLNPTDYKTTIQLGNLYFELSQFDNAKKQFNIAISISKDYALAYTCMAYVLAQEGDIFGAEDFLNKSQAIDPQDNQAITMQAMIARFKGEYDKSRNILLRQIDEGYISTSLLINFSAIANTPDKKQDAINLIENNIDELPMDNTQKRQLYFSLGKLYDNKNHYDKAFKNYRIANQLKSASFNNAAFQQDVEAIREVFTKEAVQALTFTSNISSKPVFIVGMPRSGSTLVDQILSSHNKIDSVGEINQINNIYKQITGTSSLLAYASIFNIANQDLATNFANNYIRDVEMLIGNKDVTKIIDKALINFLYLGLIQLLFPQARVIHCVRNPLDTCLSCYFQDFIGTYQYSYDLVHLGKYYNAYEKLMQHWEEVLTIPIYKIFYEDMVSDPVQQSKNLVRFLDVEWDEACTKYYESERSVVTSSSEQVRKPIYSDSVYRYKNYEKHIQPLMKTLDNPL